MCGLSQELYDEIISYFWNDPPSLKACSLANRRMTVPCQKLLFYCIELRWTRSVENPQTNSGTSYNFHQLLAGSPQIAGYIKSLHIQDVECIKRREPTFVDPSAFMTEQNLRYEDYILENGDDLDLDGPVVPYKDIDKTKIWLWEDKFLPLCAPLLRNLNALTIVYEESWSKLSSRVLIGLLHLMQLPSLHYLCLNADSFQAGLLTWHWETMSNILLWIITETESLRTCPFDLYIHLPCQSTSILSLSTTQLIYFRGLISQFAEFKSPDFESWLFTAGTTMITRQLGCFFKAVAVIWKILSSSQAMPLWSRSTFLPSEPKDLKDEST